MVPCRTAVLQQCQDGGRPKVLPALLPFKLFLEKRLWRRTPAQNQPLHPHGAHPCPGMSREELELLCCPWVPPRPGWEQECRGLAEGDVLGTEEAPWVTSECHRGVVLSSVLLSSHVCNVCPCFKPLL